jgi:2,4-dienoyl-CoA reductase-like NADH-dependent reductase (Old Yellow Enzyme family)
MFNTSFSPLEIASVTLPNRYCFLAHRTNFALAGKLTDRLINYYEKRAIGGAGLIILGEISIHPNDRPWEKMIAGYDSTVVNEYQRFTKIIHGHGSKCFAQLCHFGFQSSGSITRHATMGPSAIADIAFGETSKAMEPEDIEDIVEAFATAASYAESGGFDGIVVDIGAESLLRQFLSPISNHRQDEYGGTLENRVRFPLAVTERIRDKVGKDFAVGIQLSVDELFWGGITVDDSAEVARLFESSATIDFLITSVGTYYNLHLVHPSMHAPFGFSQDYLPGIREKFSLPVIAPTSLIPLKRPNRF